MHPDDLRLARTGALCGFIGTAVYIGLMMFEAFSSQPATTADYLRQTGTTPHAILPHFALVGAVVLWAVGFLGIGKLVELGRYRNAARVGAIFGIVACGLVTAMLIVQGAVMVKMGQAFVAAASDADRQAVVTLYRGLRVIDQGLDLAFDVFFFTGWICLAVAMIGRRPFSRVLAWLIIAMFLADVPLQLWYAPTPPPFDMGPFGSFLLLAAYAQAFYIARRTPVGGEQAAGAAAGA